MKKGKKKNKVLDSITKSLKNVQLVLQEGNYKLFAKQMVVIVLLIFGYRYVNNQLQQKDVTISGQIDAVHAQQKNEQSYLSNKKKLLELEPRFPNLEEKNDWLLRQVVDIFKGSEIIPSIGASQTEDSSNSGYTVASLPVNLDISYKDFGKLLANIENREEFVRVSEFSVEKDRYSLGTNHISMRFNTIFPQEKIASLMFQDEEETEESSPETTEVPTPTASESAAVEAPAQSAAGETASEKQPAADQPTAEEKTETEEKK